MENWYSKEKKGTELIIVKQDYVFYTTKIEKKIDTTVQQV